MPSDPHRSVVEALFANPMLDWSEGADTDVSQMRAAMESATAAMVLPDDTQCTPVDVSGIAAEWIALPNSDPDKAILYLHGGGYVLGSIDTHRGLAARIAEASGTRCLAIDYRLAPEHPFPAAVEDATGAYRFMLEAGLAPENLAIGGDSAGGGLTFASLVALRDAGDPLPAAAFALSPWCDLEGVGVSMETKAAVDPMIQRSDVHAMAALYLNGQDVRTPLASPIHADLSGLPPILVQVGTAETLLDDATRITERAREAGVTIELDPYEDLIHVFQAFAPLVPESVEAIEKIGAFIKRHL